MMKLRAKSCLVLFFLLFAFLLCFHCNLLFIAYLTFVASGISLTVILLKVSKQCKRAQERRGEQNVCRLRDSDCAVTFWSSHRCPWGPEIIRFIWRARVE